jgi:hypothetical protein
MCTHDEWYHVVDKVKEQCLVVATNFTEKFSRRFPSQELMSTARIIFP